MLGASLLAGVQVLLYVGGVITLMIFGVMITHRHEGLAVPAESAGRARAAVASAALFGVVAAAIFATDGLDAPIADRAAPASAGGATADVGRALLGDHVLAFEVVSVLLLATIIGAIVIARKKDAPVHEPAPARSAAHEVTS
jgi:NADH-quinone oxidoreductase subunit J